MSSTLKKGFSLLELLIISGIVILVAALLLPVFNNFRSNTVLNNASQVIISQLRLAKNKTISSEGPSRWGVYFKQGLPQGYTLFKGTSYGSREIAFDENHNLPSQLEFSEVGLAGSASEIVFNRLTGQTNQYGFLTLRLKSDPSKTKTIYIEESGRVQLVSEAIPSDAGRIKDFRHVHLVYSRLISVDTEKIIFTFIDGADQIIQEIDMATNLVNGQFFWEGKIAVGGEDQEIKIHTDRLNSPDTLFCLHRDGQNNTKALKVDISGDLAISPDLVSYSADGFSITKGNSIFVSDPLSQ
jgi:Tfp pilus assembly protein FimT